MANGTTGGAGGTDFDKMVRGENGRWGRVITAMVTPFDKSGGIDHERAASLAQWLLANGSDGLVINGTTGESPTTTHAEKIALLRTVVEAVGGAKVIAGAGGNSTREVVQLAEDSAQTGVTALLSVAPYYNKPSQEGLYQHFKAVANATSLPVILYNVPGRTITNIEADTTERLAGDIENIVATKEASANLLQIGEILRRTPATFDVYSGDDGTTLPILALGGAGVISVISHICGNALSALHRAWFAGDCAQAARLHLRTLPLTRTIFSAPSPAPLKYALSLIGQAAGGVRLPLVALNEAEQRVVAQALREYMG